MSTTAKRNFMNGNSRSSFNMKDNWTDYAPSGLSPNRQNKGNKYQPKGARAMTKGASFSDADTANRMLFNGKCSESMATVPNESDCALSNDDSSLMINQDPAIAAIAPTTDLQKDEHLRMDNKQAETASNASIVPQIHCDTNHYHQQYQAQAYQSENGQLIYGSTPTAKNGYEMAYDGYSTPNHNHQIMQQQYVWQSTSAQQPFPANDYASVAAANAAAAVINTSAQQAQNGMNTPVNMASPPTAYYTPSYQSYVYDPAMAAYPNMVTTTYSPMSSAQAIMSSPQQHNSAAMFHTYQTPPPLTKYPHQLYMTPPASGSPSDLLNSNPDRNLAACESSPQTLGQQQQQQQQQFAGVYTTASPYMYTSSYLTSPPQPNTAYQYQTPIMYSPPQAPQGPAQLVHHQPSLLQTPTTAFQNLTINTNTPSDNKFANKYNNNNNNNSIKANHYSYKKNPMNKSRQLGGYSPMSSETPSHLFSPMSAPSPAGVNQQLCFDESLTTEDQTASSHAHGDSPSMYRQGSLLFPPASYMSPIPTSNTMPFQQTPTAYDFSGPTGTFNTTLTPPMPGIYGADYNQYDSYGDEFVDENEPSDANAGDDEGDEQLACQICRGRRMCFCYFLKVRYYKFPSFFDLVDHQYKKWRSTMATKAPRKA